MDSLFYFLSFVAVLTSIMVVVSKNPIHSVLYLILTFFAIAGHYILLNAHFLAIVHIVVYAGAIMVLFLFVIMFLNLNNDSEAKNPLAMQFASIIASGLLFLVLVAGLKDVSISVASNPSTEIGLVSELGKKLFNDYVVPFEITSILFLSAMIGAVVVAKK